MNIIKAKYEILTSIDPIASLKQIELIGRVCYKSEERISTDISSAEKFCRMLIARGHEAMLEHSQLSVKFTVDRGVSHELVRHRIASFAQESTRYCNYGNAKFGNEITFIQPLFYEEGSNAYDLWRVSCANAEYYYLELLKAGSAPQEARSVLPNSTKTEIIITANYREWRNFFKLRIAPAAHPQMREVTIPLFNELKSILPCIFEDLVNYLG